MLPSRRTMQPSPSQGFGYGAEATAIFQSKWSLYDAIIEQNYMNHREIHAQVRTLLAERAAAGGYTLLDLGCGNARLLAPTLVAHPPSRYTGIDLSSTALREAAGFLQPLPACNLREMDMQAFVESTPEPAFDVIFSSFAVHHLKPDQKPAFLAGLHRILKPGGLFLLVDHMCPEGMSRDAYLRDYMHMMRTRWNRIPPAQIEEACDHVTAHDYPEAFSAHAAYGVAAGFAPPRLASKFGSHEIMVFAKP